MNKYLEEAIKERPWLEIKGDEDEEQLAAKSRWHFIMSMSPDEKQTFWHKQRIREEEDRLESLIQTMHSDTELIQHCHDMADRNPKESVEYLKYASKFRRNRVTIKDVRKQRERVQWQRQKLTRHLKNLADKKNSESKE